MSSENTSTPKHQLSLTTEEAQRLAAKDPELRLLLEAAIPEAFVPQPHCIASISEGLPLATPGPCVWRRRHGKWTDIGAYLSCSYDWVIAKDVDGTPVLLAYKMGTAPK